MRLAELFEEYSLYLRVANKSPHSIDTAGYAVQLFTRWLAENGHGDGCESVTTPILRRFIADLQERYAPSTVAARVRTLKTVWRFGVAEDLLEANPFESKRLTLPREPDGDVDTLSTEDVGTLLRACDRERFTGLRNAAIITLLFDSGIRVSELTGLTDTDIEWEFGTVSVKRKGGKVQAVPVSSRTIRLLRRYYLTRNREGLANAPYFFVTQTGGPLNRTHVHHTLKRLGERVGLQVYPHKLRHSFATTALREGAREFDIQGCLGHSTLTMTRRYAKQTGADLAAAHRSFSPADRLKVRI